MESLKIGDRVVLTRRIELTHLEIDTNTILVIEDLTNDSISLRYGKRKEQVFTSDLNYINIRPVTTLEIGKMNESNSIVLGNLNVGKKGMIDNKEFMVSKIYFSPSILSDYFEIIMKDEKSTNYCIPAEQMKEFLVNEEKEKKVSKLPQSKDPKIITREVSEEDLKHLVSSILGPSNEDLILELPTPREFVKQLIDLHEKHEKQTNDNTQSAIKTVKSSVKPIQPIGTPQKTQTTSEVEENFEKELVNIGKKKNIECGVPSKVSIVQIDGVTIELLKNGEIKVPAITRKNLSTISEVLNKLDTILNFKGEM